MDDIKDAVFYLRKLLQYGKHWHSGGPGDGWYPLHAIHILALIKSTEALENAQAKKLDLKRTDEEFKKLISSNSIIMEKKKKNFLSIGSCSTANDNFFTCCLNHSVCVILLPIIACFSAYLNIYVHHPLKIKSRGEMICHKRDWKQ